METEKKKRGRPATGLKRDKRIIFSVTDEEHEKIKKLALQYNLTMNELLRKKFFEVFDE